MYKYIPKPSDEPRPLVVVLHGMTQDHSYAHNAGWDVLAERHNFILLTPEQPKGMKAFTWWSFKKEGWWFSPAPQTPKEAESIKQMIDKMKADYKVDAAKVYITGLSAGGAMTAVMIARYPGEFAGAGICSGLPYKSAMTMAETSGAMKPGVDRSPQAWAKLVKADAGSYQGSYPKVSIWHGLADTVVASQNATELMEQWTAVHNIDQTPDPAPGTGPLPNTVSHLVYKDAQGNALVETCLIKGMDHGTAIDPGSRQDQGGVPTAWVLSAGVFSSYHMARFWGLIAEPTPPPSPEPSVTVNQKVNAVLRLLKGEEATAVLVSESLTNPPVNLELLETWRGKFLEGGRSALSQ